MVYEIIWTTKAEKQFSKLDKPTQKRVITKLESVADDPFLHLAKLVGYDTYKIRVGNYRVLLGISKKNLIILNVGHRKNIYKK